VLVGTVRAPDCSPIAGARVEYWYAVGGGYSKSPSWAGRGTTVTTRRGTYRIETGIPFQYASTPHIHLEVAAPDFATLFVHYDVKSNETRGRFDLVLARQN
jgi:protocatechuate 3,4-dioxygenase beta subunit